jgi:hypothetical protein
VRNSLFQSDIFRDFSSLSEPKNKHAHCVAEPKLFVSAPALAPAFKKFRLRLWSGLWLRLQLCNYLFAQLLIKN